MTAKNLTQGTILASSSSDANLPDWIGAFLLDRKAQHVSPGTLKFYQKKHENSMLPSFGSDAISRHIFIKMIMIIKI